MATHLPRPGFAAFRDPMLARMLGFGFLSGLPLPLSSFTLQQWFASSGLSVHVTSVAAVTGLSYVLKFLWAPLFDRAPPAFAARLGRRRFWLLAVQPLLAAAAVVLALSNPAISPLATALAAAAVAFLSTCQDISVDAWRIETFPEAEQGAALTAYVWGYRGANILAAAGVIRASASIGWHAALLCVAALLACGVLLTATTPAPREPEILPPPRDIVQAAKASFVDPLLEFLARPAAWQILACVVLFRLGKVLADNTAAAFYHTHLHFSDALVGDANGLPPLLGLLGGAAFGGWLVAKLGSLRAVVAAGALMAASLGLYLVLLASGAPWMLFVKIGGEYFFSAAADIAFLTYVSALCARAYTATQYALLSALASVVFHSVGSLGGFMAEALGWGPFYVVTMLAGLPALALLWRLRRKV